MEASHNPDWFMLAVAAFAGLISFVLFNCLPYLSREALGIHMGNGAVLVCMIVVYIPFYFVMRSYHLPEYETIFPTMVVVFLGVSFILEGLTFLLFWLTRDMD